jgi:hypothetical protein
MRTFDRAMYAMFLLVLLADVARAESLSPGRVDVSAGLILSAATHDRVNPVVGTPRESRVTDGGEFRLASPAEGLRKEFFSSYRTVARRYGAAHVGPVRSIFDGSYLIAVAAFAPLQGVDIGSAFVQPLLLDAPAIPVIEHTGSPAP